MGMRMTKDGLRCPSLAMTTIAGFALAWFLVICLASPPFAWAQTFRVIHNFGPLVDGANPSAGLAIDGAGRLYGTTFSGGAGPCRNEYGYNGCGTVFELARRGSGWVLNPLYSFHGQDGAGPQLGSLTLAPNGTL